MERRGIAVEVLGVPNILPDDRIVDKLTIHFLRPRHGGGEVRRVLYPSYLQGQALVIFEEAEVAARVLQHAPHVIEIDKRQFPLTVKPADRPETDIPVEATLDISIFPDQTEVMKLLKSYGFETTPPSRAGQVRVKGSFMSLTAVKARMEKLLNSQTHSQQYATSSHNGHSHSTGAISKARAGSRGNSITPHPPMYSTNSSSLQRHADQSSIQSHRRAKSEVFTTDEDVLRYALSCKKQDIALILNNHTVKMDVSSGSPGLSDVSLSGSSANVASRKLQELLGELTKTLRTQQICLSDYDSATCANIMQRMKSYHDIYPMVAISRTGDTIYLVGLSQDSYEVKQRLLGKQLPPVRAGRTSDRGSKERRRSSSLPRSKSKSHDVLAITTPDTQDYYQPSKYQDEGGAAAAGPDPPLQRRQRSSSESRGKVREERAAAADHSRNEANQADPGTATKNKQFLKKISTKDIKNDFKKLMKGSWK